jgi:S1-C subfamily serine protease
MTALWVLPLVSLAAPPGDAVLVAFSSQNCPHCRTMEPILTRLTQEGCPVQVIDADRQPDVARQFRIQGVPTFVALAAARETGRIAGSTTYEKLVELYRTAGGKPQQGAASGGAGFQPTDYRAGESPAVSAGATPQQVALAASVKLRVEDATGFGCGTGTIIDTHEKEALIITCGHLFRESQGKGKITVEVYAAGAPQDVEGQLIAYDLDRDIALVSVRLQGRVTPVAVASPGQVVRPGDAAFSVGCDRGAEPTVRLTHITAVNKYQGRPNFTAAGQPVDGRSGGGLFSGDGKLIGICNAADPADDEGLYAGLASIHWQLDQIGQSAIYQRGSRGGLAAPPHDAGVTVASFDAPLADRGPASQMPAQMTSPGSQATPNAIGDRGDLAPVVNAGDDSEIVFIVRSKRDPQQRSEVFVVDQAPPDLLARIAHAARTTGQQRAALAQARSASAAHRQPSMPFQPPGASPIVRGQTGDN